MKLRKVKIRALDRSVHFDIPATARNKGYWVEFNFFSLLIITKSFTIIIEV